MKYCIKRMLEFYNEDHIGQHKTHLIVSGKTQAMRIRHEWDKVFKYEDLNSKFWFVVPETQKLLDHLGENVIDFTGKYQQFLQLSVDETDVSIKLDDTDLDMINW